MYIHHAKNIAEGIDYKDTGYIYNPALSPDGHFKIPHLWPGQNTPATG